MIRKASLDDIPAIMEMAGIVFPETYKTILSRRQISFMMEMMYSRQSLRHQIEEEGVSFFICDGKGYVSFRYEGTASDGIYLFHLDKLYVMPMQQGTGLGRKLFETVIGECGKMSPGHFRIELNVNRNNKAVSFYEHLGMKKSRQGDFPIGEGFYMNDYIMSVDF